MCLGETLFSRHKSHFISGDGAGGGGGGGGEEGGGKLATMGLESHVSNILISHNSIKELRCSEIEVLIWQPSTPGGGLILLFENLRGQMR